MAYKSNAYIKKRSLGSLKMHILIFIFTFYTFGIMNVLYALYRIIRPKKVPVKIEGREAEALKEERKIKEEEGKTAREAMRTGRKFL